MKRQKPQARFALCVRTNGSEDLEQRKVYEVVPDRTASREGYVRVIDESGEDYLYPAEYFVPVNLPVAVAHKLGLSAHSLRPTAGGRHRSRKMLLRAVRG
jgi:hypothetical protein